MPPGRELLDPSVYNFWEFQVKCVPRYWDLTLRNRDLPGWVLRRSAAGRETGCSTRMFNSLRMGAKRESGGTTGSRLQSWG